MADYSQDKLDAYNSIKDAGVAITVRRLPSGGTYDPVTDSYTGTSATVTTSTYAVFTLYNERYVDGAVIQLGDRKALIPAYGLTIELQPGDQVVHGSEVLNIIEPNPVAPSGDPILYKAQARK